MFSAEEKLINEVWKEVSVGNIGYFDSHKDELSLAVNKVLLHLDKGELQICQKKAGKWVLNEWVKKSISLYFKLNSSYVTECSFAKYYDKIGSKFQSWRELDFVNAGIRIVPGAFIRYSSYLAKGVVVMPSFVNMGAYVGARTMIDSGVTVGSCCTIGENCHISSNVVIGGVLEPVQAYPVIIEDNCFVGAQSSVLEGVIVSEGAVISGGVTLAQSTKIYDCETGELLFGTVPPYSVVVPGNVDRGNGISSACAVIIKKVDEKTRSKTSINDLLRG